MTADFKCEYKEVRCITQCKRCKISYIQIVSKFSKLQVTANGKGLIISLYDKSFHKWNTQTLDEKQANVLLEFLNKRKDENDRQASTIAGISV